MDGENHGSKPYEQMDDLGGFTPLFLVQHPYTGLVRSRLPVPPFFQDLCFEFRRGVVSYKDEADKSKLELRMNLADLLHELSMNLATSSTYSKVVSAHLWNTPLNLYQQPIKGFLS